MKLNAYEDIRSALIVYVQKASFKMRNYNLFCKSVSIFLKTSKNNSYFHWGAEGKKGSVSIKKTKECLVVSELI